MFVFFVQCFNVRWLFFFSWLMKSAVNCWTLLQCEQIWLNLIEFLITWSSPHFISFHFLFLYWPFSILSLFLSSGFSHLLSFLCHPCLSLSCCCLLSDLFPSSSLFWSFPFSPVSYSAFLFLSWSHIFLSFSFYVHCLNCAFLFLNVFLF